MKHAALTIALLLSSATALAQSGATIPHEFAVRLRPGETIADVADSYSAVVVAQYAPRRLYLLRATPDQDDGEIEVELELDDRLEEFEQNRENSIADGHTQSFFVGIAPGAYDKQPMWDTIGLCNPGLGESGRGWSIAVLDTGVFRHTRFAYQVRTDGTEREVWTRTATASLMSWPGTARLWRG